MADKSPPTAADLFQVIELTNNQLFFCVQRMREYNMYNYGSGIALDDRFKSLLYEFQELCDLSAEGSRAIFKQHLLGKISQSTR